MQDAAWQAFAELADKMGAETESAIERAFEAYESQIRQLENEKLELQSQLRAIRERLEYIITGE